jgi:hypothetical protein
VRSLADSPGQTNPLTQILEIFAEVGACESAKLIQEPFYTLHELR